MIVIIERWTVIDRWWSEVPIKISYCEVEWDGRKIVFRRIDNDPLWRIFHV